MRIAYNSCRNRCTSPEVPGGVNRPPGCSREAGNLLPVEYHHVVFTLLLAGGVNPIGRLNPGGGLRGVDVRSGPDDSRSGGQLEAPGWRGSGCCWCCIPGDRRPRTTRTRPRHRHGRRLRPPTAGGVRAGRGSSLPVRVLSRVFRGKFLARMNDALARRKPRGLRRLEGVRRHGPTDCGRRIGWLYCKPPFGGPQQVLKYLARYTHRVAIGNSRLVKWEGGRVTFTYKDYADASKTKAMTLDGVEFLRRWVSHVLPRGFVKVRHYGLLANRHRAAKLALCRRLLRGLGHRSSVCVPEPPTRTDRCPACGVAAWVIGERFGPGSERGCGPVVCVG